MVIYIVAYLIFTVGGLIFIKLGATGASVAFAKSTFNISFNINIILGLIMYLLSFLLYVVLLRKFDLSYIVPLTTSITYIATVICGFFIFKEKITPLTGVAIVIILIGIILLNLPKK